MPPCSLCGTLIVQSTNLARHQQTEPCRLRHQLRLKEAEISALREELSILKPLFETIKSENDQLKGELRGKEDLRKIVEKAALRPTTTTNHVNRSNYLQYLSSEPINFSTLQTEIPKLVTAESLLRGPRRFNKMITTAILEDDEGKTKIVCTDQARKQFAYKDENSGDLISDPSLERLRERMRVGVDYPTLYDEILEELNADGGKESENQEQAFKILCRAKFEAPFVNHVAKRAYKCSIIRFEDEA
jgi:hypothetical protein